MTDERSAVREFVAAYLDRQMERLGVARSDFDDFDKINVVASGIVDSIGFIELVAAVEDEFGVEVELDAYDPAVFTTVTGLVTCVVESRTDAGGAS